MKTNQATPHRSHPGECRYSLHRGVATRINALESGLARLDERTKK